MNTENIKENVERVVEDLTRLRDEGRVRLNLLGKELRDRWAEIERQVEEIARQARDASGAALDRARELRDDLRRELGKGKEPPPSSRGP
jgi:molybdenum-dependent DNA-binding transcriptional regulator ModE